MAIFLTEILLLKLFHEKATVSYNSRHNRSSLRRSNLWNTIVNLEQITPDMTRTEVPEMWAPNELFKGKAKTASMGTLTLFESRYTLKGRYSIGNVGQTASTSMLSLYESRYTLKGRYSIGNVGQTASTSMLSLYESRYTWKFQLITLCH